MTISAPLLPVKARTFSATPSSGGQYNFGTEALSQLASVLYGVDSDDDGNSCPSKKLDETETDHAEAAHHNHVTEGWSGVEYPVEGGVQVGRQHAHPWCQSGQNYHITRSKRHKTKHAGSM